MFNWASKEEEAFHVVKDTLGGPLPLAHYDPRQKLIVAANACQFEIGGALLQRYADGTEKYVFHMSKAISSSQRNYISQIEKEFFQQHFILHTDRSPCCSLLASVFQNKNT